MPDLRNEWWLASRIYGKNLCTLFCGVTDPWITMARMRTAIIERGLKDTLVSKSTTFQQAFERLYGRSLQPKGNI